MTSNPNVAASEAATNTVASAPADVATEAALWSMMIATRRAACAGSAKTIVIPRRQRAANRNIVASSLALSKETPLRLAPLGRKHPRLRTRAQSAVRGSLFPWNEPTSEVDTSPCCDAATTDVRAFAPAALDIADDIGTRF